LIKIKYLIFILLNTLLFSNASESGINNMKLKDKIAQMIMVRVRSDYYSSDNYYKKRIEEWILNDKVGGLITFDGSGNVHGMYNNHKYFQKISKIPLFIASDLERGAGQQMKGATLFPSNMAIAATSDSNNAYIQGEITAKEAKVLGIHMIFAPVLDVNNNSNNPIINLRAYSDNPDIVSEFGLQFIKGIQDQGLYACPKHFPGHGNTSIDSHTSLPIISSTITELNNVELKPFKDAVKNNVKMIMMAHIAMPALDKSRKPASHSHKITTELLIDKWSFEGLIITDGMEMSGITNQAWSGESAIRAIEAGSDIILLPIDVKRTIESIYDAVLSGRISEERINISVNKILKSKKELKLFDFKFNFERMSTIVGNKDNLTKAANIASSSITLVKDINSQIPIKPEKINKMAHLILTTDDNGSSTLKTIKSNINYTHGNVKNIFVNYELSDVLIDDLINRLKKYDKIIVSTLVKIRMNKGESTVNSTHLSLIKKMYNSNLPFLVVSYGSPYLDDYTFIDTYVCSYGYGSVSQTAVANAIFGRKNIDGVLPINLNSNYKRGDGISIDKTSSIFNFNTNKDFSSSWSIIHEAIKNELFPGAQILVIKDNEILADKYFGYQTFELNSKKIDSNTIYDIASLTKVVATTPVVMKLIKKKYLHLNHQIYQFYPEFRGVLKDKVTIKHLLTHSSGLKPFEEYFLNNDINNSEDIIKDIVSNQSLLFEPGAEFKYSDLGMILLMDIAEKVTGRKFADLVQSWVFNPINMNNSFFNPPNNLIKRIAPTEIDTIYRNKIIKGIVHDENTFLMGGVSGHAGVFSNTHDIAKYAQTMINFGLYNGSRIFNKGSIKKSITKQNIPYGSDYALGWDTPSIKGNSSAGDYFSLGSFGHLGFTGTSLWIDPNEKIIIILLTNRTYPNRNKKGMYRLRRDFHNEIMSTIYN
jgi:beta-N-acetylhexosaminidase